MIAALTSAVNANTAVSGLDPINGLTDLLAGALGGLTG